jgi:hypothetical protein
LMPGSPRKRSELEREAAKRLEVTARVQADERARELPKARINFTPDLGAQIAKLIANGVSIEDSTLNGAVLAPGIASRIGIHPGTFYDWQQQHPDFAEDIARARKESAHRIADRMLALADAALREPALANSVRVAADILKWQAQVRNPGTYGERQRIELNLPMDLGERLRRAKERLIEHESSRPVLPPDPA